MIVAITYCTTVWVLVQKNVLRPKVTRFLVPLAVVSVAAALTTFIRFLPAFLNGVLRARSRIGGIWCGV
jgi:hypothetical protein